MCVVAMLKLVYNKRCAPTAVTTVSADIPEYIMLDDRLMTVGRSYKADVKIMLPYISRKHLSVSNALYPLSNSVAWYVSLR